MHSTVTRVLSGALLVLLLPANVQAEVYSAYGLRRTDWIQMKPPADINPRWFQVVEAAYSFEQDFGIDLGLFLSDDLDELLEGFVGGIHYKYLHAKVERGKIEGTYSHSTDRITPFDTNMFDGNYLFLGLGVDTTLFWEADLIKNTRSSLAVFGLAYIRFEMPTTLILDYHEKATGPKFALDPDAISHNIAIWLRLDSLSAVMRGFTTGQTTFEFYDNGEKTVLAIGTDIELMFGVSWRESGDAIGPTIERFTGKKYVKQSFGVVIPPFSFSAGMGIGLVFTTPIFGGQVGTNFGIECRTHSPNAMPIGAYDHYDESPESEDQVNGACCEGTELQMLWGPFGKVAFIW